MRKQNRTVRRKKRKAVTSTMIWEISEKYRAIIPIKRLVALKYVLTGRSKLEWYVPVSKKDKSLKIEGIKIL